jgi:hypothetical protein
MKDTTELDRTDRDILTYHVPDEVLEAAAGADEGRAMTWANCTHVWWCWPL